LQIRVWDRADDPRFVLTVYEPLRGGKKVGGVGGLEFLDYTGAYARLGPEHSVLEFGSGMGDGCEYIATHFGSRVTGVELAGEQIRRARERHGDPRSRNYDFVHADFLEWQPPERYDAVFFLEMLPIIHDCRALLQKIHGWLRPGGALTMTDFVAGPNLTDEDRAFLWQEDGIVHNLPSQAERLALLQDVGFQDLDVTDITHKAITQQERILEGSYRHKTAIVEGVGIDSWQNWVDCARIYGQMFIERKLVGLCIGARRA
jgi:cyclopropane fatty-acyl-phospholipid synthase-like methyltransferase